MYALALACVCERGSGGSRLKTRVISKQNNGRQRLPFMYILGLHMS